ncbi:MAG: AAA family ATPase [Patescibacteria group bacterium]|nr:AAA family ATPase [Patescibacteria group bacterium]
MSNLGKIIVITGGPRSGKSTLVRLLAQKYDGIPYLEQERFPERISQSIQAGGNSINLRVWFRNHYVSQYIEAMECKKAGKYCFLDGFWFTSQPYIEAWMKDEFEQEISREMLELDKKILPWPDNILVLQNSREGIRKFSQAGGRGFEDSEFFFNKQLEIHNCHDTFFEKLSKDYNNISFLDRGSLDFRGNPDDLDKVIKILNL